MSREPKQRHPRLTDDEAAGTRPAVLFALMLAVITGAVAVVVFVVGLQLVNAFVHIEPGPGGLLTGAAIWLAFWVGLSGGLIGGLALGYRAWRRVAPPLARRAAEADARDEAAAAVQAAEALLEQHSTSPDS